MFILDTISCNGIAIDTVIPNLVTQIIKVVQFGIPVILILLGMLDLGKAVMSNDEKEMKGAQGKLIKRVVYAVLIFLIIAIVKLVFGILANSGAGDKDDFTSCIDCFTNYSSKTCGTVTKEK